jgi:hypothetical protein
MTATNHALTGAVIGLMPLNPAAAVMLAFISHFICDALPHFGSGENNEKFMRSRGFMRMLVIDILLCLALVAILAYAQPFNWLQASICAFVATLPDMAWLPGYLRSRRGHKFYKNPNTFMQFATRIQWFEKPIGTMVEIAWFIGGALILGTYVR